MVLRVIVGALKAGLEYICVVMGGAALVISLWIGLGGSWFFDSHGYTHPGFISAFVSGIETFLLFLTTRLAGLWFVDGCIIWACVSATNRLLRGSKLPVFTAAAISIICSAPIPFVASPVIAPTLPAYYVACSVTALLGCFWGVFLSIRISRRQFQESRLGWKHTAIGAAWVASIVFVWGNSAYARAKISSVKDPPLNVILVKWTPEEGDVREEPVGKYSTPYQYVTDSEIEELRAAGLKGVLHGWAANPIPGAVRFVIVMSRPIDQATDLPKPSAENILYMQTEDGFRRFPSSATTVNRTVRLIPTAPNQHNSLPSTCISVDIGLGHPQSPFCPVAFSWLPAESQSPLPSLQ
jgi:hypothetical protein